MQIRLDGPRLVMTDLPERGWVGLLRVPRVQQGALAFLVLAAVMQIVNGQLLGWDIPADWRFAVIVLMVAAAIACDFCAEFADRKALTTTFDGSGRTVSQRRACGLTELERHAPFAAIAGVEIVDHPARRWWQRDPRYVLQARLTSGDVWPLTTPCARREQLADCAAAIEIRLAARS